MTKVLMVNPVNPEPDRIDEAADVIRGGGTVAFPTETVYGIGADAMNGSACAKIFSIKNRPMDNPLIVHICSMGQLGSVALPDADFPEIAKVLWPGPVTFILKKNAGVPDEVTAGLDTVAVRMPAHTVALRLIERSGTPIAAPSANISQRPSATKAEHVIYDLDGKVDMILDGGDTAFGLESTIVDMTTKPHVLLRPGAFTLEELERYLGRIEVPEGLNSMMHGAGIPAAPGMKYRHYSPDKMVIAVKNKELLVEASKEIPKNRNIAIICSNEMAEKMPKDVKVVRLGAESNLYEISKNLFDSLRKIDRMDVEFALVQTFPERGIGLAIMNRIMKATRHREAGSIEQLNGLIKD